MTDFYKVKLISTSSHYSGDINKNVAQVVKKNFVAWSYTGGGIEGVVYCENKNGTCNIRREFMCDLRGLIDSKDLVCKWFRYELDGKEVQMNDELYKNDKVFRFLIKNLPEDRRKVENFGDLKIIPYN